MDLYMNNQQINNTDYYLLPCGLYLEDFIAAKGLSFALGSALKYAWRAGKKDGESASKDLKKRKHYVDFLDKSIPCCMKSWSQRVDKLVEEARTWRM